MKFRVIFAEKPKDKLEQIKEVADKLSELIKHGDIHLSIGATGRFYIYYYDDRYDEPFRAIKLPPPYGHKSD